MSQRYHFSALKSATNEGLRKVIAANGFYPISEVDSELGNEALYEDYTRNLCLNGVPIDAAVDQEIKRLEIASPGQARAYGNGELEEILQKDFPGQSAQLRKAYWQGLNSIVTHCLNSAGPEGLFFATEARTMNLVQKDGAIFLETSMRELAAQNPFTKIPIPGSVKWQFKLTPEGFQLQWIDIEGEELKNLILKTRQENTDYNDFIVARHALLTTLQDPNTLADLRDAGQQVLNQVDNDVKKGVPYRDLTPALKVARGTVKDPLKNAGAAIQQAQVVSRHSWGKPLAGALICLAGAALIAASVAVAVVSFGAASPLSIGGVVIGASLITGGIAVATGTLGLAGLLGGMWLFARGVGGSSRKRRNSDNQRSLREIGPGVA